MMEKLFKSIIGFFKRNQRRLIILVLFSIVFYGVLFVTAYIAHPEKAIYDFNGRFGFALNALSFVLDTVATYFIMIFHVILPLMQKKGKRKPLAIACLLYTVKLGVGYWVFSTWPPLPEYNPGEAATTMVPVDSVYWFLLWNGIFYSFDLITSFSMALMVEWVHKSKQQITLEKQKAEAELSALKHQINPHFLFNSLSFVYAKTIKVDEDTAQSVLILADIMRYALGKKEDASGRVSVMEEVEHIKNVIEINQRRHDHRLNIQYEEYIDHSSATIIPLVLITLVENAFKHGDLHDKDYPILINLHTNERELSFYIKNKKGNGIKELSNGIGLQNIHQQLKLKYGENYTWVLEDDPLTFGVLLKIPLSL